MIFDIYDVWGFCVKWKVSCRKKITVKISIKWLLAECRNRVSLPYKWTLMASTNKHFSTQNSCFTFDIYGFLTTSLCHRNLNYPLQLSIKCIATFEPWTLAIIRSRPHIFWEVKRTSLSQCCSWKRCSNPIDQIFILCQTSKIYRRNTTMIASQRTL